MTNGAAPHPLITGSLDLRRQVSVSAGRANAFAGLLAIGEWWPHRARGDSTVTLEPYVGGRFFQSWSSGATLYGLVTAMQDDERLTVDGPLTLPTPTVGSITFALADSPSGGTTVTVTHRAFGAFDDAAVRGCDAGWTGVTDALLAHLGAHR
ncbi:MAG: SRPBCC domain-containing protein [Mycobacteriales bacterium]